MVDVRLSVNEVILQWPSGACDLPCHLFLYQADLPRTITFHTCLVSLLIFELRLLVTALVGNYITNGNHTTIRHVRPPLVYFHKHNFFVHLRYRQWF